jgi:hypothetical protein
MDRIDLHVKLYQCHSGIIWLCSPGKQQQYQEVIKAENTGTTI